MARENPPAIRRQYCSEDRDTTVCQTTHDTVSFIRGLGDSGKKYERVECECPNCNFPHMFRRVNVSPEAANYVEYWCLNPNCGHYLGDMFSFATKGRKMKSEPTTIDSEDV